MIKKKIKIVYFFAIILTIFAPSLSIYYFLQIDKNKNYIAITEITLGKQIDHIFLDPNADRRILQYATRSFENLLPDYEWELNLDKIEAKLYTRNKKFFYNSQLPNLKKQINNEIPKVNQGIKKSFAFLYNDETTNDLLGENDTGKLFIYYRLSTKPFYTGVVKAKVRFRKNQLTDYEFIAITLFVTFSLLVLLISYFYVDKRKHKAL